MSIPIFLSADNNYAPYMSATIVSVAENTNSFIDFYILDSGISDFNRNKILLLQKKYKNLSLKFISIDTDKEFLSMAFNNKVTHLSKTAYNRFLISKINLDLNLNLKKVIYLDIDIIAAGDIQNLYNYDLTSYVLGAVPGQMLNISNICKNLLGLSATHKFFNSGVLLIDIQKFNKQNILEDIFRIEQEKREKILYFDQDILNVYFENNYLQIDKIYNYEAVDNDLCDNFVLRHYTSSLKPWQINPEIETNLLKNKELFWYYLAKTDFYEDVLKNCIYNTKESLHQARLQKLLVKHMSKDPMKYLKNKNLEQ